LGKKQYYLADVRGCQELSKHKRVKEVRPARKKRGFGRRDDSHGGDGVCKIRNPESHRQGVKPASKEGSR